ncbi:transketolase-like protein 2 [Teleopsis dalmanni]|uniref:transketolase-like protein 2 n=1 Tax=Teleopsis dalmanni TaxID=139649 RepID=UPI0018CFE2D4|nr:transketolase-like protein 2 [Teleopsis dalmanni]
MSEDTAPDGGETLEVLQITVKISEHEQTAPDGGEPLEHEHAAPDGGVTLELLQNIAHRLRIHAITATESSKSGHPTSCSSIAEILSILFFKILRLNMNEPRDPASDRLVLSKGHAAPILYSAWAEAGLFPVEDLKKLRKIDSDLEGHPTPRLNFIDVGTGSLGQGVAIGAGMAYVGKNFDKSNYRIYVIVGDGESAEGSIWESLHFAAHYKLDNLCVIFDVNRLGQSDPTSLQHEMNIYEDRLKAFGFNAKVVDGHNLKELNEAFNEASNTNDKPTAIIAKTFKGKYFMEIEDAENWHGKPLGSKAEEIIQHLQSLITDKDFKAPKPLSNETITPVPNVDLEKVQLCPPPEYEMGQEIATRLAYGTALAKLAKNNPSVIALDGDTKNSTFSEKLKQEFPERFIECYIAEQNLVGVTIGATCRNRTIAFGSSFAAFLTRAFDQFRMGAISQTNANFSGSHCGISIGEDGPSQMGLEDIAMFRTIPGSTIFYPSDAVSCERAVELAAKTKGMCFIRTSRPNTPVIYKKNETFEIGKGKIVRNCKDDLALLIGAGVTLHECLKAAENLRNENISVRVLDPFTVKPLDACLIQTNARECYGNIIVVEDHYQQGGLGEAVLSALAKETDLSVMHLYVTGVPRSGPSAELLDMFGISAQHIQCAVKEIVNCPCAE